MLTADDTRQRGDHPTGVGGGGGRGGVTVQVSTSGAVTPTPYSKDFFAHWHQQVRSSAEAIVPLVMDLLHPSRVVEVGCGSGTWLATFLAHGATEVRGFDGAYIDRSTLEIPADRFMAVDLTQPVALGRGFDLAVCLEVAEHLPASRAASLVHSLAQLAPVVLFSAAGPLQGGVDHVNEQWPEYWADHFARHGYVPIDCFRRTIWRNEQVAWFYAQNLLLYADARYVDAHPALSAARAASVGAPLALVHPTCFLSRVWEEHDLLKRPIRDVFTVLRALSKRAVARRFQRYMPHHDG
jgi:SAM-dependent methyltransferase